MATLPASPSLPPLANLRDVGGHPVRAGGRVRTGLLFRSTDLGGLDAEGVARCRGMGIRTVYDLRSRDEREARPDRLPDGVRLVAGDVLAGAPPDASPFHLATAMRDARAMTAAFADGGAVRFFVERYREFVELDSAREAYGELFRDLATNGSRPALVHCATGKDRTGWAVAALLLFLDVPDDVVMDEYLASNAVMEGLFAAELEAFRARGGDPAVLLPLVGVRALYLETALRTMRERFGDVEAYFATGLGVDAAARRALRRVFVEGA